MDSKQEIKTDRRPWIIAAILGILVIALVIRCFLWPVRITTVYIVRHAEKADGSADPPLSAAGQARAEELAHVLADAEIDAVFVTTFLRTQQTGAPVAVAAGVTPQPYPATATQDVANTILADHIGDRVLVVGHSNTVDNIAVGLGTTGLSDLGEDQYDRSLSSIVWVVSCI